MSRPLRHAVALRQVLGPDVGVEQRQHRRVEGNTNPIGGLDDCWEHYQRINDVAIAKVREDPVCGERQVVRKVNRIEPEFFSELRDVDEFFHRWRGFSPGKDVKTEPLQHSALTPPFRTTLASAAQRAASFSRRPDARVSFQSLLQDQRRSAWPGDHHLGALGEDGIGRQMWSPHHQSQRVNAHHVAHALSQIHHLLDLVRARHSANGPVSPWLVGRGLTPQA